MPATTAQARSSIAADRRQLAGDCARRWAANELARLAWERGESEEDAEREPRKAQPGWMNPDRGDK